MDSSIPLQDDSSEEDKQIKKQMSPGGFRGRKRTHGEREAIKTKMQIGMLSGSTPNAVMKALDLPPSTYWRYAGEIAKETREKRLSKADQLLHIYFTRTERLLSKLEDEYGKTNDPAILSRMNIVIQQTFDKLQSAGFLPKTQEKIHLTTDRPSLTHEDFAKAYAEYKNKKKESTQKGQDSQEQNKS